MPAGLVDCEFPLAGSWNRPPRSVIECFFHVRLASKEEKGRPVSSPVFSHIRAVTDAQQWPGFQIRVIRGNETPRNLAAFRSLRLADGRARNNSVTSAPLRGRVSPRRSRDERNPTLRFSLPHPNETGETGRVRLPVRLFPCARPMFYLRASSRPTQTRARAT